MEKYNSKIPSSAVFGVCFVQFFFFLVRGLQQETKARTNIKENFNIQNNVWGFFCQRYFLIHNQSVSFGIFIEIEFSVKTPKFCQQLNCISWRSQHPSTEKSCPVLISNAGKITGSCGSPLQSMKRHNQLWTCFCLCNCGQRCCCCSIKRSCREQTLLNVGLKLSVVHYSIGGVEPVFVTVMPADMRLISRKTSQDNWEAFRKSWI